MFELEDENRSYSPRYEALLQRNRELDERNRELAEMINKAIEIQAEAYKTNILKEVEINTGEIMLSDIFGIHKKITNMILPYITQYAQDMLDTVIDQNS